MPRIYGPEQLIYQLETAMKLRPEEPSDDADYWKARAALEIARQIERLETTIRTVGLELGMSAMDVLVKAGQERHEMARNMKDGYYSGGLFFHNNNADCRLRNDGRCPGHQKF